VHGDTVETKKIKARIDSGGDSNSRNDDRRGEKGMKGGIRDEGVRHGVKVGKEEERRNITEGSGG